MCASIIGNCWTLLAKYSCTIVQSCSQFSHIRVVQMTDLIILIRVRLPLLVARTVDQNSNFCENSDRLICRCQKLMDGWLASSSSSAWSSLFAASKNRAASRCCLFALWATMSLHVLLSICTKSQAKYKFLLLSNLSKF